MFKDCLERGSFVRVHGDVYRVLGVDGDYATLEDREGTTYFAVADCCRPVLWEVAVHMGWEPLEDDESCDVMDVCECVPLWDSAGVDWEGR